MKIAVAACAAIAVLLGTLTVRHALAGRSAPSAAAQPSARAPVRSAAERRALAGIDQRLHRKLRKLAEPQPLAIAAVLPGGGGF